MSNKIKEVFSDDMFSVNGTLRFSDGEAYKNFLAALEIVYSEGRAVPIEGVTSVSTTINHQGEKFPLDDQGNISKFYVGPVVEQVPIALNVDGDEKAIILLRTRTKDKVILRSSPDSIVAFEFYIMLGKQRHTINYKVQFDKAKTIAEVAESFSLTSALLSYLFKQEDHMPAQNDKVSLSDVKEYFLYYKEFFKRLSAIESDYDLSIPPSLLNNIPPEEQHDVDELYLLLYENKIIRLDAKLSSTDLTLTDMEFCGTLPSIGSNIALVFTSTVDFSFLKQTVRLYTANLVVNALVKDIQKNSDSTKILYGDTDSQPMYISFSAYKTNEEAEQETKNILKRDDIYKNALTSNEYIKKLYSVKS